MIRWCRVFGRNDTQPRPEVMQQCLHDLGLTGPIHFRGDVDGWTTCTFNFAEHTSPLVLECFLAHEKGIRAELNSWAAWVETCDHSPRHIPLMERVIQTKQLYTLSLPSDNANEARLEAVSEAVCRFLAEQTAGIFQIDGRGFFSPNGELLLQEY